MSTQESKSEVVAFRLTASERLALRTLEIAEGKTAVDLIREAIGPMLIRGEAATHALRDMLSAEPRAA
jgi:hypothetical protein